MVKIGSARINEDGEISGGQPGDQTGKECAIEDFYVHKDGWVILRCIDKEKSKLIAQDMVYLCENDLIGYDQPKDKTLFQVARKFGYDCRKVNQACDTDCAQGLRVCLFYAEIYTDDFYTGNEIEVLEKTGYFEIIRDSSYTSDEKNLMLGDILCTPKKGHTAVVVKTDGRLGMRDIYCSTDNVKFFKTNGVANIREYAGTDFNIYGVVPSGKVVLCDGIVAVEEDLDKMWYHITYNGVSGFVSEVMLEEVL